MILPEITILLSTYNGSRFLQQQLDSLYQQTYPNTKILVRDDGSIDNTLELLLTEQNKGCIELLPEHHNLGPGLSFFQLFQHATLTETDYIAFCDQDDVWLPDKLSIAAKALAQFDSHFPVMYCSRVEIVDESLKFIRLSDQPKKLGFGNALFENVVTGCTIVLNRPAIDLIGSRLPKNMQVHDWWCYIVMSCFGEIIFDSEATIKYRQHSHNTIGVGLTQYSQFFRKLSRFFSKRKSKLLYRKNIHSFKDIFINDIPDKQNRLILKLIDAETSIFIRIKLMFSTQIWRQKRLDDFILRLFILINYF